MEENMRNIFVLMAMIAFILIVVGVAIADDVIDIMGAAGSGDLAKVKTLVARKPVLANARDSDFGRTVLMRASENGFTEIAAFLLSHGAEIEGKDNDGMTALIYGAMWNQLPVVEFLIAKSATVNVKDKMGMTALLYAASNGHKDMVDYLLSKGANIMVKDKDGKTPLKWAQEGGYSEVVELLKRHGAKE
jgi:uncharacterized protein